MPFFHAILTHPLEPEADRSICIAHGCDKPPTFARQFTLFAGAVVFDENTLIDIEDWPYSASYEDRRTIPCTTFDLPFHDLMGDGGSPRLHA